ncbi:LysR family transcriptional regulator [Robbsia andropogonis]|uniref:LysR family transcriptional regulator n=1 Tax=Robbsia andropogonis TaxID=28092 RepID=UPI0004AD071F|nr:LysR family transcriptional regulator [Robbsia andropogonis]
MLSPSRLELIRFSAGMCRKVSDAFEAFRGVHRRVNFSVWIDDVCGNCVNGHFSYTACTYPDREVGVDYAAWKLFIDAAELGSLSKTAVFYETSQPHISRQIVELEHYCGGRLFHRTGRGVVLTELGERIAPRVRAWVASTEQLSNDIRTTAGEPIGIVRIGILPSTAYPLVSTLYQRLKAHYPSVQLRVREGQGALLETWLENGNVDLAILFRHSSTPKNGDEYLVETATYLVGAAGDPLTKRPTISFRDLDGVPLVSFCRPNSWRDRLDQLSVIHGVSLNVAVEADSLILQSHIVAEGGMYALLGPYAIANAAKECKLQSAMVIDPLVPRFIALAMSPHGELTLACRTVMRLTKEIAHTLIPPSELLGSTSASLA